MKEYIGRVYVCSEAYDGGIFGQITIPKGFKLRITGIRGGVNLVAIILEGNRQFPRDKEIGISPRTLRSKFKIVNKKIKRLK